MAKAAKPQIPFEDFLMAVDPAILPYVTQLDAQMRSGGCDVGIEPAKSGYVVSYKHSGSGRVLANFVFRKQGLILRFYGDNVMQYMEYLETLPPAMKAKVAKAPLCKRLVNPDKCNPHCAKGYEFILEGENHQKCRYNCFMFFVTEESAGYLQDMLDRELAIRNK